MSVEIEKEIEYTFEFDVNMVINTVVEECLNYEKCPYEAKIMVTLTDDAAIRQINKEYRNIDKETDVLSFPMLEYEAPGDFSWLESEEENCFNCFDPETGELVLGDIVISVDRAVEQACEYGHSLKREIGFLTAHSMFHLFGYDHMEEAERDSMEARQRAVLDRLGIIR